MARAMFPLITVLCQQNTFRCFTHIMHDIHHVLRLERRPDKLDLLGVHAELGVGQAAQLVDEYPREEIIVRREVFCRVGERVLVGLWRSAHRAAGRERSSARRLVELEVICRPAEKGDTIHAQEIAMKKEGNKVGARWVRLHRPFRPLRWCARHVPPGHETTRQSQVNSRVPEISLSSHFHPSSIHPPATRIHSLPQSSSPRPTTLAGSLYAPCSFYRPTRSFSLHARSSFRVGRARDARFALLTFSQCPSGPGFS
jgi:hypothetical protein